MVENHKQWHEKLPFSLLRSSTTVDTSTGATYYLLVYGTEVVMPADVDIPSLTIIHEAELSDAEWIRSRYEQLALIDRNRMNAVCHGQLYHNRMSIAFNKRVKPRQFALGKLVLKKIFLHQYKAKGKFSPNWQSPYMVHRVLTSGSLMLAEIDREVCPKLINSNVVKRYYVWIVYIPSYDMARTRTSSSTAQQLLLGAEVEAVSEAEAGAELSPEQQFQMWSLRLIIMRRFQLQQLRWAQIRSQRVSLPP
ncbi:uncharacterized protein [Nicotiana sylvestris]|uniref:uncharacterized protein n=1 Tax=Nicotiana sylvestris TaxID=4096 RepID=UPI00388C772F